MSRNKRGYLGISIGHSVEERRFSSRRLSDAANDQFPAWHRFGWSDNCLWKRVLCVLWDNVLRIPCFIQLLLGIVHGWFSVSPIGVLSKKPYPMLSTLRIGCCRFVVSKGLARAVPPCELTCDTLFRRGYASLLTKKSSDVKNVLVRGRRLFSTEVGE